MAAMPFALHAGSGQIALFIIRKGFAVCQFVNPHLSVSSSRNGTLFSAMHATAHDPQPVHLSRLITIPYFLAFSLFITTPWN
jgi:hypothetical protein